MHTAIPQPSHFPARFIRRLIAPFAAAILLVGSAVWAQDGVYVTIRNSSTSEYITDQAESPKAVVWQGSVPLKDASTALWASGADERRAHWLKTEVSPNTFTLRNRYTGRLLKCAGTSSPFTVGLQDVPAPIGSLFWWTITGSGSGGSGPYWFTSGNTNAGTRRLIPSSGVLAMATASTALNQKWVVTALPPGASVPWIRYTRFDNGFAKSTSTNILSALSGNPLTTEAADETALDLAAPSAWIEWTVAQNATGMVIRFSVPDHASGGGLTANLDLLRNGSLVKTITLDSKYAHIYGSSLAETDSPAEGSQRRVYDDVRVNLALTAGQVIRLRRASSATNKITINFIELEPIPAAKGTPSGTNVFNVTAAPYSADSTGVLDALAAIKQALADAGAVAGTVYLPAGTYRVSSGIKIPDGVTLTGDGLWHTTINFAFQTPSDSTTKGGFVGNGTYILRDLRMLGSSTFRESGQAAFNSLAGTSNGVGSVIDSVWWEHFNVARFVDASHLHVRNCRSRNNFADGIVAMGNNHDFVVDNCNVRAAGDDSIANWSSATPMNARAIIRYNTIELANRAGGIGLFGGESHLVHHNYITDSGPWAQADIRITADFDGPGFAAAGTASPIEVYENIFSDCRASYGSILFSPFYYPIRNILVRNSSIISSQRPLIYIRERAGAASQNISNVTLRDMAMGHATGSALAGVYLDAASAASGSIVLQNVDRTGGGSPSVQRAGTNPTTVSIDAASSGW